MAEEKQKIDLSMYGVAEIIKWCITRNNGRIPGCDTAVFKALQAAVAEGFVERLIVPGETL